MPENTKPAGHLFVLHGVIQNFDYDAVIIPTDHRFDVRPYWPPSVTGDLDWARPTHWPAEFGRSGSGDAVWF
ncbi:hypothetical protein G3I15_08800, partial [Streptomyces sp. SID10244]|nr:hypothetical protein [Streptomyces sp. SID10244]